MLQKKKTFKFEINCTNNRKKVKKKKLSKKQTGDQRNSYFLNQNVNNGDSKHAIAFGLEIVCILCL